MSFGSLIEGLEYTLREEGVSHVAGKVHEVIRRNLSSVSLVPAKPNNSLFDVIFINGCDPSVPHPIRYRVAHQIEQLAAAGLSASAVDAWNLDNDIARHARMFIIFRCPVTDEVKAFISLAKRLNKTVLYDIDDLVIDTEYTNCIPYVTSMSKDQKRSYDDGVTRMGETLKLCDGAITTTEALADELRKYVPRVYINRNTASELMRKYSEIAIYRRDVLPAFRRDEVSRRDLKIYENAVSKRNNKAAKSEVRIGYFSGSITHNDDFDLVLPAIVSVLRQRPNVTLLLMGELSLPDELASFRDRIISIPFSDWRRMPNIIASCDINIAPLRDTLFNRAKSENKWIEASLVKVPTVASCVGAFEKMIIPETGILCQSSMEWEAKLLQLVDCPDLRRSIGEAAYSYCTQNCTTISAASNIREIIKSEVTPNYAFVMPSLNTSGGVLVALRHAAMLQDAGNDVVLVNTDDRSKWFECYGHVFPVLNRQVPSGQLDKCPFSAVIDNGVATLWDTVDFLKRYPKMGNKYYLVQNFETDFMEPSSPLRLGANATYFDDSLRYLTISKWCEEWLRTDFARDCRYVPNGIDGTAFDPQKRKFGNGKIRILIEGDCSSEYKNVDESFLITNRLDPDKYEIWYMSYTAKTKPFYRIDNNLGAVPHDKVADVYKSCHILLKTSVLESFSYPPLEMMATGGYVVARPNEGNSEYLVDGENCLLYQGGDYEAAVMAIERISLDESLRNKLYLNGLKTAKERDWETIRSSVVQMYSD